MSERFLIFAQLPAGLRNTPAIIAACRAGGVGVINAELESDSAVIAAEIAAVAEKVRSPFGVRADVIDEGLAASLREHAGEGLGWLIVDPDAIAGHASLLAELRGRGVRVLVCVTSAHGAHELGLDAGDDAIDGIVLKGHEAGGSVGEDSSFVLLQKWLRATSLPLYVHGGLSPQVAAACSAVGVAGGFLDSQLLLLEDLHPPASHHALFGKLAGSETVAVGDLARGEYFRVLLRPGHNVAKAFASEGEGKRFAELRSAIVGRLDWQDLRAGLLPVGQDVCFAAPWRARYRNVAGVLRAMRSAVQHGLRKAVEARALTAGGPLARALNIRLPIVQGPMTRVSDKAEFARVIADAGALPMVALATVRGASLRQLLADSKAQLGDRVWGIGLLGFAPQDLLDEQLKAALEVSPSYAIIAGGRPDQAVHLEKAGIPSFLHVPAAALIGPFVRDGARRFIFEGRECGGHVGPLSSFVLWSTMVATLVDELGQARNVRPEDLQVLFAGGVHDAISAAMVQVLAAPLVEKGVNIGILMGSAYLFTKEIVDSGAIVPRFQREVLACDRTVTLGSGPGHASRCAYTPFAEEFFGTRERLASEGVPADEHRRILDELIVGRLRIASKGLERGGPEGRLEQLDEDQQYARGMYMLGQVAMLRNEITDVATLHADVTEGALALLEASQRDVERGAAEPVAARPVDIAIIGIGSLFPKANSPEDYWENILESVDGITEIPAHRWDWRLYFDSNRQAKDKIYSKWGGFLDDLVFDPMKYGIPPKSLSAVDPMQLIALEVAQRTLSDAGYADGSYDHERTSVVIGSSGGTGDVGTQYCLRSELPRYAGELPEHIAAQLPEWTEDSFAGILANVIAGRIANRLNFGGVNFTTDAACASSLSAVYQAVNELVGGRSDLVIAGGVDTVQGPFGYLCFSKTQALSPRGRCASFDAKSDGIVISEGVAMIALKRLADAERDGDRIYAVIKGVGGSSDGNARGLTAPLPAGQLRAMRRAYAAAGFGPETVGLFEAHGTGTVAGDIAELKSTSQLIRQSGGRPHQSVIGSVKTTIGHTKSTAGIAGLVKVALALHRRVLPPHRGVEDPNPVLVQKNCPVHLVEQPRPWLTRTGRPRRGAVSAFGFGGTNFHVVLEEHAEEYRPWLRPMPSRRWPAELLLWSAADKDGLVAGLERLRAAMTDDKEIVLRDLAAGLAERFTPGGETLAIVARNPEELATALVGALAYLRGETATLPKGVHHGSAAAERGKVAVLFSGQGSQYPEMFRELMVHFSSCADTVAQADELLAGEFEARFGEGRTLGQFIFPRACYSDEAKKAAVQALTSTDVAQPALGAVDAAAFHLLRSLGLQPDLLAGHSFGEFVALYAGGSIDFESMLALAAARGRAIVDASKASGAELGTMAAVLAPRDKVEAAIADLSEVVIANHNAPEQIVLSGSTDAVREAGRRLAEQGIRVTEFPVAAGFHSPRVAPASDALASAIEATAWKPASIPVYSNTTAEPHAADVDTLKRVMAEHLVRPVEFVAQVEAMYRDGARVFVELGPKAVLSGLVDRILGDRSHVAVSLDRTPGIEGLLDVIARIVCAGAALDVRKLFVNRATPLANPYELPNRPVVPKHAWLINGSGARPAGTPPKQVGITLEDVQARAQALAASPEPVVAVQAPIMVEVVQPAAAPIQPISEPVAPVVPVANAQPIEEVVTVSRQPLAPPRTPSFAVSPVTAARRPKATNMNDDDQTTMNGYFNMMRQFLETQERVMAMYMRSSSGAQPVMSRMPSERVLPSAATFKAPAIAAPLPVPVAAPEPVRVIAPTMPQTNGAPKPAAAPMNGANGAHGMNGSHGTNGHATHGTNGHATNGAHHVAPAPAPAPAAAPPKAAAAPSGLDRDALTDMLLRVVEEKTGYPRDMVGLTQNLESDLGIDSIKRIEVASAMLELLPEGHRKALTASLGQLNTQPTLDGMLNIISAVTGDSKEATLPFDVSEAGVAADVGHLPRYIVVAREQSVSRTAPRRIERGRFIVTDDGLGLAELLEQRLLAEGCTVVRIARETLADEATVRAWIEAQAIEPGTLAGIVHLAAIGARPTPADASLEDWRRELFVHEKSLFVLLRDLHRQLVERAHVLAATGLGGTFGRRSSGTAGGLQLQGGAVGMLKSHLEERPTLRVRAVDLDPNLAAGSLVDHLFDELALVGGRIEIGYPNGRRTAFHTVPTDGETRPDRVDASAHVVVATGGGRGVTAEILRELARPGNTLILTGRRPLAAAESADTAGIASPAELRNYFIAQARSGARKLTPAEIGREVQGILADRELRQNIEDFRRGGATVEYHAVDGTHEAALRAMFDDVRARFGDVTGILHGAGIIEDKLLVDKPSDSWSRVVETKVLGLLLLQKWVRPEALRFFAVMSSVAGRYGNSGQTDYATANELMNRLCAQLRDRWSHVNVVSMCWGPWGPTKFGAGMVTAATEAKFAEKGVYLVSAAAGRGIFADALRRADLESVELVCGEGPWEAQEAAIGAIPSLEGTDASEAPADEIGHAPLLGYPEIEVLPKGERVVPVRLDANHAYLADHRIDGIRVLPAAGAVELFAEAAASMWPGWKVVEVRDCRLLKGIDLPDASRTLHLEVGSPGYGSSEGFEVNASLWSPGEAGRPPRTHYRCMIRLAQQYPESFVFEPQLQPERQLSVDKAYGEWLFHGRTFQVIEQLEGLATAGGQAIVRSSTPAQWLALATELDRWVFDPAVLDAAPQMAILWARSFRDQTVLPARFGRVVRYGEALPERMRMVFECLPAADPSQVNANVYYLDPEDRVVLMIEELQGVASSALNRLSQRPSPHTTLRLGTA